MLSMRRLSTAFSNFGGARSFIARSFLNNLSGHTFTSSTVMGIIVVATCTSSGGFLIVESLAMLSISEGMGEALEGVVM